MSITITVRILEETAEEVTILNLGYVCVYSDSDERTIRKLIVQSQRCNTCFSGRTLKWLFGFPALKCITGNYTKTMTQEEWKAYKSSVSEVSVHDSLDY